MTKVLNTPIVTGVYIFKNDVYFMGTRIVFNTSYHACMYKENRNSLNFTFLIYKPIQFHCIYAMIHFYKIVIK